MPDFRSSYSFILPVILLMFAGCGDDEPTPRFTYTIDGINQKQKSITGVLAFETQYDHEGRTLLLTAYTNDMKWLSVVVGNWDFQNPPANGILTGTYDATLEFENTTGSAGPFAECLDIENTFITLCSAGLVTYYDETGLYFSAYDNEDGGTITITSCNTSSRTVSGSFITQVKNFDDVALTIAGTFENVKYRIQN